MHDDAFLRAVVEPYVDRLYRSSSLLNCHRDTAAIHLLRFFDDAVRFATVHSAASTSDELQLYLRIRHAQEGLPWALRWVWSGCRLDGVGDLELNWDVYEEAGNLCDLSFRYYHLYRCFVLYSRGVFSADVDASSRRVRFAFKSQVEELRDAGVALYLTAQSNPPVPAPVRAFINQAMPVAEYDSSPLH